MNISFSKFTLDNGLRVILHADSTSEIVTSNLLYNIGSKHEDADFTGLAHLFEHLMFSGTKKNPNFDSFLEKVGAQNNAFTNSDFTNYYITIPSNNLEHALYVESDRMSNLMVSKNSLETQKNVVIEEFNQNYLNQPYGDLHLLLRAASYNTHPYKWCTIGKDPSHIKKVNLDLAQDFFDNYYVPNNAILVIAGNINLDKTKKIVHNYFSPIPFKNIIRKNYFLEPKKTEKVELKIERDVPSKCIALAFHMSNRTNKRFYTAKLISHILSSGISSRLHKDLVVEKKIFSKIETYLGEDIDPSLFYLKGFLNDGVDYLDAEKNIFEHLKFLSSNLIEEDELFKVIKKNESSLLFSHVNNSYKALDLAFGELLNNANLINEEIDVLKSIARVDIINECDKLFVENNCTALYYGKI